MAVDADIPIVFISARWTETESRLTVAGYPPIKTLTEDNLFGILSRNHLNLKRTDYAMAIVSFYLVRKPNLSLDQLVKELEENRIRFDYPLSFSQWLSVDQIKPLLTKCKKFLGIQAHRGHGRLRGAIAHEIFSHKAQIFGLEKALDLSQIQLTGFEFLPIEKWAKIKLVGTTKNVFLSIKEQSQWDSLFARILSKPMEDISPHTWILQGKQEVAASAPNPVEPVSIPLTVEEPVKPVEEPVKPVEEPVVVVDGAEVFRTALEHLFCHLPSDVSEIVIKASGEITVSRIVQIVQEETIQL